jgi:hypothetical protein
MNVFLPWKSPVYIGLFLQKEGFFHKRALNVWYRKYVRVWSGIPWVSFCDERALYI